MAQNHADPPHDSAQLNLLLQRQLPALDPVQLLADDGLGLRRARLHAGHLLEAQELPGESVLPVGLHAAGGLLDQRGDVVLRVADCRAGAGADAGPVRRADPVCVPDQIRLHQLDAVPDGVAVVLDPVRVYGRLLPHE